VTDAKLDLINRLKSPIKVISPNIEDLNSPENKAKRNKLLEMD